jgi:D-alanyl-D-alanine carboxypeptidase
MRLLLCFLAIFAVTSCSEDTRTLEQRFQSSLDDGLRGHPGIGVSAAVIVPGEPIWLGTSGVSHDTTQVSPDMLFAIGSITKNMVASLTLQLADEGVLSLEDSLGKWLPAHPNIDDRVTIRQLLNHTSGIYQYFSNQAIWDEIEHDRTRVWTHEEVLTHVLEPYFPPGGGFRYSNTNYTLLGMIIETATATGVAAELRGRFWEPLGLSNTYLAIEEEIPDNVAHVWGSLQPGDETEDLTFVPRTAHDSIIHPSGGVFATAEDLARWSDALFRGKVISESQLDQMLEFVAISKRDGIQSQGYGLGIQHFLPGWIRGVDVYGHAGGSIGTVAYMLHLPEHDVSIAAMINSFDGKSLHRIVRDLAKVAVDHLREA